jgi:hypothetical protein
MYFRNLTLRTVGMCVSTGTYRNCYVSAMSTTDRLLSQLNSTATLSPTEGSQVTDLLSVGLILQGKIYPPLLAAAGSFFLTSVVSFALFKWSAKRTLTDPNASSITRLQFRGRVIVTSAWTSVGLALASAVSITEVSAALQFWSVDVATSMIWASGGTALQVLQWLIIGLSVLFALAVTSIVGESRSGGLPKPGGFEGLPMPGGLPPKAGPGFPLSLPPPGFPMAPPPPLS